MSVRRRGVLSIVVLELDGSFFGDIETEELAQAIDQVTAEGNHHLILDLTQCKVMNSTALSVLTRAQQNYAARDGLIRLCGIQKRMHDILSLTRLLSLFGHHATLDEALASFAPVIEPAA
jgi:anti-sigma B factor antagonist